MNELGSGEESNDQEPLKKQLTGASFLSDGAFAGEGRENCLCLDVDLDDLVSLTSESTVEAQNELLLE